MKKKLQRFEELKYVAKNGQNIKTNLKKRMKIVFKTYFLRNSNIKRKKNQFLKTRN